MKRLENATIKYTTPEGEFTVNSDDCVQVDVPLSVITEVAVLSYRPTPNTKAAKRRGRKRHRDDKKALNGSLTESGSPSYRGILYGDVLQGLRDMESIIPIKKRHDVDDA